MAQTASHNNMHAANQASGRSIRYLVGYLFSWLDDGEDSGFKRPSFGPLEPLSLSPPASKPTNQVN